MRTCRKIRQVGFNRVQFDAVSNLKSQFVTSRFQLEAWRGLGFVEIAFSYENKEKIKQRIGVKQLIFYFTPNFETEN